MNDNTKLFRYTNIAINSLVVNTVAFILLILSLGLLLGPISMGFYKYYDANEYKVSDFFIGFKKKFLKTFAISAITMGVVLLVMFGTNFLAVYFSKNASIIIYGIYFLIILILVVVNIYIYPLLYLRDSTLKRAYMNALLIGMYKIAQTFIIVAIAIIIGYFLIALNPFFMFFGIIVFYKVTTYLTLNIIRTIGFNDEKEQEDELRKA